LRYEDPELLNFSRAACLLPVVQKILGHSTPNLAASYVEFSDEEMREVARYFVDKRAFERRAHAMLFTEKWIG